MAENEEESPLRRAQKRALEEEEARRRRVDALTQQLAEKQAASRERLHEWIRTKWKGGPCPVCGVTDWTLAGDVYAIRPYSEQTGALGGKAALLPVVPVTCGNCGNTLFINAVLAGAAPFVGINPADLDPDAWSKE